MDNPVAVVVERHLSASYALDALAAGAIGEADILGGPVEHFNCGQAPGMSGYATMCPHCVANAYAEAIDERIKELIDERFGS